MPENFQTALAADGESADTRAIAKQLGSAEELTTLSPTARAHQLTRIHSLPALRDFLIDYRDNILAQREMPAIYKGWNHAARGYWKELLQLDQHIANDPILAEFQLASRHVGKQQLNRLAPLKDIRAIQRYREAVNNGKAYGWHTLVYGVVLAAYSLPLRQGLLHYGRQTFAGFIYSASRNLELPEAGCLELQVELASGLPGIIDQTVAVNGSAFKLLS